MIYSKMGPPYDDIINMNRPISTKHPPMSLLDRAAQFSPFAALTGQEDAIREKARYTNEFVELCGDEQIIIDRKLQQIRDNIINNPEVTITYFEPDALKTGGKYVTITGRVKKIDEYEKKIIMLGGDEILIKYIVNL